MLTAYLAEYAAAYMSLIGGLLMLYYLYFEYE